MVKKFETIHKRLMKRIRNEDLIYQGSDEEYDYYTLPEWPSISLIRILQTEGAGSRPGIPKDLPGSLKYLIYNIGRYISKTKLVFPEDTLYSVPMYGKRARLYVQRFTDLDGVVIAGAVDCKVYDYFFSDDCLPYWNSINRFFTLQRDPSTPWEIVVMPILWAVADKKRGI